MEPEAAQEKGKQDSRQLTFAVRGDRAQVRKWGGLPHPALGANLCFALIIEPHSEQYFSPKPFCPVSLIVSSITYEISAKLHLQSLHFHLKA
jgi:hypothetical protein